MCHKRNGEAKTHPATAVRKAVRKMLTLQAWQKLAGDDGVQNIELLALCEQLCKLVGSLFDLADDCASSYSLARDHDCELVILGPDPVVDINKGAKHLTAKQTANRTRLRIRPGNQTDVEARSVGAIDDRGFPTKPEEKLPAVSALVGISLQRSTPSRPAPVVAGSLTEVLVNSEEATGILSVRADGTVRKSLFPAAPQVFETTWAPRAVLRVRKRTDFRTRVAD
jgi:hypothetical protein